MRAFFVTVALPAAPPVLIGRSLLVDPPGPRRFSTLTEAVGWVFRNADTFRGGLLPGETYFTAWIHDEDHEEVRTLEFARELGAEPVVHRRKTLRAMKAALIATDIEGGSTS